jgi:hypothetical protein
MASDILEQLAEAEVPPAPVDKLEQGFNERLNNRLVVQHLLDFVFRGLPFAAWHMTRGMLAVVYFTIAGRFIEPRNNDSEDSNEEN